MAADDERLRALHDLAVWLEAQPGARAAGGSLEIVDYEVKGYGFRAKSAIARGSTLCAVPVHAAFSRLSALASPTIGQVLRDSKGLREDDILGVRPRRL